MSGKCKYCGNKIRRKSFETNALYEARQYCEQPKCLREGRQDRLEHLYHKDEPEAMRNHRKAFITRALFLLRWGMEPMEAFDKYGHEATEDWERLFFKVKEGRGLHFIIKADVYDGDEEPIASVTQEEHVAFDYTPTVTELIMLTTSIVNAGHNRLLQEDTNGRKME
jgi:hypothetical protein